MPDAPVIYAESQLGIIEGQLRIDVTEGIWSFDQDDWALIAMLQDPIYMAELLFQDPKNPEYSGCYHVIDYQYPLFRVSEPYEIHPCGRSLGKTESIKARGVSHAFKRQGEDLLVTAPEMVHLKPLTDAIESRIRSTRLTRDFLDVGHQKAQPLDACVLTPYGWTTMGEIEVGDVVIGSDGKATEVVGVYPQGRKPIFRVGFSDGSETECCEDHLWEVTSARRRNLGLSPHVKPLCEIMYDLERPGRHSGSGTCRWHTRAVAAIEFERNESLPLDPYLLGALLGDGGLSRPHAVRFTTVDQEIMNMVCAALPSGMRVVQEDPQTWRFTRGDRGHRHGNPLVAVLRDLGLQGKLSHEKSVPESYLYSSIDNRLALLQGLMDTDGHVSLYGQTSFASSSEALANDLKHIVCSLGGRANVKRTKTTHRDCFSVFFRLPDRFVPCRLKRKVARLRTQKFSMSRSIKNVVHVGSKEALCIKVAANDGLYVTDDFILTHNTGITHNPFQVTFLDGTKIMGRIPKLSGTGVKGMHGPDLLIDEGQDYPEKGYIEVHETVIKDHVDRDGHPDFTYQLYGVHSGSRDGRFYKLASSGEFRITQITGIMRPGWGPDEKRRAAAIYGGTQAPDYRRNILGEAGGSSSAFFVTARLFACMDQDTESRYNTAEFKRQRIMSEEVDLMLGEIPDKRERTKAMYELLGSILDLPETDSQQIYFGADIGLVNDPTVITIWAIEPDTKKKSRMKLIGMLHLWRFREQMIRQVMYHIGWKYGARLRGAGSDVTGLGLPIFQTIEDDEMAPQHLLDVMQGYVFSAKVAIGVDESLVSKDSHGNMRDAFGNIVEVEKDPFTGIERYIVKMSMIEASTRYLREFVDATFMWLPFDPDIAADMQGETEQRVKAMAGVKKKPNAFHILDSMRTFAMIYKQADVDAQLAVAARTPVLARAVDAGVTPYNLHEV